MILRSARARVLVVACCGLAWLTTMRAPLATADPPAAASNRFSGSPCATSDGVTIVVDFQDLGGGVHVRCAAGRSDSGFEALRAAGIGYDTTVRFPGFLCRINGQPDNDPCIDASPATAYWSYWLAERGGQWCYSNFGAGNRNPPEGTVEGWSFSLRQTAAQSPPPRTPTFDPVAGSERLPAGDCERPAPATSVPAPSTSPVATAPPPSSEIDRRAPTVGSLDEGRSASADGEPSTDGATGVPPAPPRDTPAPDQVVGGDPATASPPGSSTTTIGSQPDGVTSTTTTVDVEAAAADEPTDREVDYAVAPVDLSGSARSDASPVTTAIGVVVIAAVGVTARVLHRRRQRSAATPGVTT